jgi:hypothetical protein
LNTPDLGISAVGHSLIGRRVARASDDDHRGQHRPLSGDYPHRHLELINLNERRTVLRPRFLDAPRLARRPTILLAEDYEVFVRHTTGSSRSTAALFTVSYDGGSATVPVNQSINGGVWVSIGTFPFAAGIAGSVRLDSDPGSLIFVVADAVQFVSVPEPTSLSLVLVVSAAALVLRRGIRK